jgi:DNA helicase-2/ATP-dependent DNA helicase PcrA
LCKVLYNRPETSVKISFVANKLVDTKRLNKEQQEAVKHKEGPLLIIAGAGTGKTTVITERIKYLILSKKAKPDEILALTFTEKAAREMEERVDVSMPYGYTEMWISTFHSFCDRVLRQEALHIGLDPNYKLMGEAETIQLVRDNISEFELDYFRTKGNPTKFVGAMLQHFSRLQDEDITPEDYMKYAKKLKSKNKKGEEDKLEAKKTIELAKAFQKYEELKVKNGFFDFGDLITKTLQLFRERKNILRQYQEKFKHILVDEFQDTNYAQNELAIVLAGKDKNITVCGDDDQSIYRFRGAAVSNIVQFRKNFKKAKIVVLTKNYRSAQEILDKAYTLIKHNDPDRLEAVEKIDKKLKSQRGGVKGEIQFIHADRAENEAEAVARTIEELVDEGEYDYGDFAILVRANNHAEPFVRALGRFGIPHQFLGPGRLFRQPEVIDLISYLRILYNFEDSISFYRILSLNYFDISPRDLAAIGNYSRRKNSTLFEAAENVNDIYVGGKTKETVKKLLEVIKGQLKKIRDASAGQLLYNFLEETGLLQELLNPDTPVAEKRAKNISKFFDKLKSYEIDHEEAGVPAIVDWIELSSELGESPLAADFDWTEVNAVNILTAHSAKGLEFPVVFLVNLVSRRFPTTQRREKIPIAEDLIKEVLPQGDYHVQEERRLFYVGMTRTEDKLFLTAADYYGEGKRQKKLSPFIFEALGDDVVAAERASAVEQLSFLDYEMPEGKEKVPAEKPFHVDYLSYSQISTFQICPLHYKLQYILKIPTPPKAALSFGSSIHNVLRDLYVSAKGGEKVTETWVKKLLKENWEDEGYESKGHEKESYKRGEAILLGYFKKEFDKKNLPLVVEKMFKVPLRKGKGGTREDFLMIGGRMDRVDEKNGKIEIVDYKTGENVPSQRTVDNDLQLSLYALAATSIKEAPFDKKPEEVGLTLYYMDDQKKITTTRTSEDLKKAKEKIFKIRKEIEESDFRCSGHMFCDNCEYSLMCRADQAR